MIPFGYIGIAAGSSVAAWYNVYLLNKHARKYGNYSLTAETFSVITKVAVCSLLMGEFIYLISGQIKDYFYSETFVIKAGSILGTITAAVALYTAMVFIFKLHLVLLNKHAKD